jgi:hypothetical protein
METVVIILLCFVFSTISCAIGLVIGFREIREEIKNNIKDEKEVDNNKPMMYIKQ